MKIENKIVIGSRFTGHQKKHIMLSLGSPLLIPILYIIINIFYHNKNITSKGAIILFFLIVLYYALCCFAFTKKGLLKIDSNLYRGMFYKSKLLLKKRISLVDKSKVSMLKYKKSQKMAWFTAANPDMSLEFNSFDITILNEKHTKKEMILSLEDESKAKLVIDFLEEYFQLKYEIYSPDFS